MAKSPAWQRKAGKNPKGGLNAKEGCIVRLNKNGTVRSNLGKYGEYGKESSLAKKSR